MLDGAYLNAFYGSRRHSIYFSCKVCVYECILGFAEVLKYEIASFSIGFNVRWSVFGCIVRFAEALHDEI